MPTQRRPRLPGICAVHWDRHTADDAPIGTLRMVLGLPADAGSALEKAMTTETTETSTAAETQKRGKATKNSAMAKAAASKAKTAKAPKEANPAKVKHERKPKEENLMVFAFRLPKAESEAFHKAAGPANASRAMRALAAAFVTEDRAAFETVIEDARKL